MRRTFGILLVSGLALASTAGMAQPPAGGKGDKGEKKGPPPGQGGQPGQPGGAGQGGAGGGRGMMGPPKPGQILAPHLQEQLKLTDAQKKQLDELQKDVDAKLAKILTDAQKKQIQEMGQRGPGGPGGGPPGGGPGGPPPGGPGGNRPPN